MSGESRRAKRAGDLFNVLIVVPDFPGLAEGSWKPGKRNGSPLVALQWLQKNLYYWSPKVLTIGRIMVRVPRVAGCRSGRGAE